MFLEGVCTSLALHLSAFYLHASNYPRTRESQLADKAVLESFFLSDGPKHLQSLASYILYSETIQIGRLIIASNVQCCLLWNESDASPAAVIEW